MTRRVFLLQLGIGRVGTAVADLVAQHAARWHTAHGIAVAYAALADSTAFAIGGNGSTGEARSADTSPFGQVADLLGAHAAGKRLADMPGAIPFGEWRSMLERALDRAGAPADLVVLDCAAGGDTTALLLAARAAGAHAVLANKDPLAGPHAQFANLRRSTNGGSLRASATVGAGLPILATIERALASGDRLISLEARASGSLGFLCDQLSNGTPFDVAVRAAAEHGYTEPDPRQDLSGFDVARKLLILARFAGREVELAEVRVESLVPPGAETGTPDAFDAGLSDYRAFLADRVAAARAGGRVLRYVGRIAEGGALRAGLVELAPDEPLARGTGPDNVFVLRTTRYDAQTVTIAGPGAGIAVTAGAIVADVLRALEVL